MRSDAEQPRTIVMRDPIRWYVQVEHVEFIGQEWPVVIVRRWQQDADGQRVLIAERVFDLNNHP